MTERPHQRGERLRPEVSCGRKGREGSPSGVRGSGFFISSKHNFCGSVGRSLDLRFTQFFLGKRDIFIKAKYFPPYEESVPPSCALFARFTSRCPAPAHLWHHTPWEGSPDVPTPPLLHAPPCLRSNNRPRPLVAPDPSPLRPGRPRAPDRPSLGAGPDVRPRVNSFQGISTRNHSDRNAESGLGGQAPFRTTPDSARRPT